MKSWRDFMNEQMKDIENIEESDNIFNVLREDMIKDKIIPSSTLLENRMSAIIQVLATGMALKIGSVNKQIKNEADTNKKLDLVADLIKYVGYGIMANLGVSTKNTKIINRMKSLKR